MITITWMELCMIVCGIYLIEINIYFHNMNLHQFWGKTFNIKEETGEIYKWSISLVVRQNMRFAPSVNLLELPLGVNKIICRIQFHTEKEDGNWKFLHEYTYEIA